VAQLLPYYSFDSGAFINGRRDIFISTAFPALWGNIEEMIALGQVRAVDEVKREVTRHDDETAKWAKAQRGLFVPLTREVQEATSRILEQHPKLISLGSNKNSADPFVVGLAMAHFGTVVTQETPSGKLHMPRIPDVRAEMGVPCSYAHELLRRACRGAL
jgi:hypothetical protein